MIDILNIKKNHLFISRAATGIYLILRYQNIENKKILIPGNICYAAVYPIIYSSNIPVFCDTDNLGNVSYDIFISSIKECKAAIIPHMYGNPNQDIIRIAEYCKKHHILLIEDCASSMGAVLDHKFCGTWGDYSLFSTGYSKTIDLGYGGIIVSNNDLSSIGQAYKSLPVKNAETDVNDAFFSKLYRLIRNNKNQSISPFIWAGLRNNLKNIYIHYTDLKDYQAKLSKQLISLQENIDERIRKAHLYRSAIHINENIKHYSFNKGAVPWRYILFVNPHFKYNFINYLLKNNVPVSDWYPNVTEIFGNKISLLNIDLIECSIINLPITIEDSEIIRIINIINKYKFI